MRKSKIFTPLIGVIVLGLSVYAGYRTYNANAQMDESNLLLENVEALAGGGNESSDCNYTNGYRTWYSEGPSWEKEKEFYDCCKVLRHGYDPSGNCS